MNNLQLGIKAHQQGQLQQAQQYYLQHLSTAPKDPDARQLLGLVYSAQGDLNNAIANMQQSLSINSAQPHVLNNLGICQKNKGLFKEAISSFEKAIKQNKTYLDPYKNLIRLLLDTGAFSDVKSTLKQALKLFPNDASIAKLNVDYYRDIEDHTKAIQLCKSLLLDHPDSVIFKHSLALNHRMAGNPARALELYNELEQSGFNKFQLFHNKANALSDLGEQRNAIEYYRKAISLNPAFLESHVNLNELLWELGDKTNFLASYQEAFTQTPVAPELKFSYASTLLRIGNFQAALEFLHQLPEDHKNYYEYFDLLGRGLMDAGRESEAIEAQARTQTFENVSASTSLNFAETLLRAGQYDRAEEVVQRTLKLEPENKHGWALQGIIWEVKGDPNEAVLNDYDNLVREYTIEVPDGFDSVEQFCEQLNDYLATLHTAKRQPLEQTLVGGTQSRGNLFNNSNVLVQALVEKFKLCINDYIEKTEPFVGRLPVLKGSEAFHFSGSWSVSLSGKGFHTQHVHPMGWLSSAFYVQLPHAVEDDQKKEGWFKLGEPSIALPTPIQAKKYIKPVVGKLVLFQSYMWHGAIPFDADETRMTVAFDVAHGAK